MNASVLWNINSTMSPVFSIWSILVSLPTKGKQYLISMLYEIEHTYIELL